jgi:pyrimidine operon attenuation protein/uracil phosphoribosyltransferase
VGNPGNETADKIAKEAARSRSVDITYRRIQITFTRNDIKEESVKKWRNCSKAVITKQYFPTVEERLKKKKN